MPFIPNKAHDIPFTLRDVNTGQGMTGASVTGYRVIDGGAQVSVSGSIVEKGNGQYLFEGVAADFNGSVNVGLLFTASGAVPSHLIIMLARFARSTAHDIPFLLINKNTGAGLTGASPTGYRVLDGGSQQSVSGSFRERGNGQYVFEGTAADFAATDVIGLLFTATNGLPVNLTLDLVRVLAETEALEHTPAVVLRQYIIDQSYAVLPSTGGSWPLYVASLPDGDDVELDALVLYDTTPVKWGRDMAGPIAQDFGIELFGRSLTYDDGWDKMTAIANAMDSVHNQSVTVSSTDYQIDGITRGGVSYLGQEQASERRYTFSLNMLITLKQI